MPTGLRPGAAAPPMQPLGAQTFTVPYPVAVGTAGPTIDLGTLMQAGTQQNQGPNIGPYSDAWLEILNYSDSVLSPQFDTGGQTHPPIPAGYAWSAPIPIAARFCTTTIAMQTAVQFFPNELLFATFYTAADIRNGFRPRAGPLVPSLPAAAIGPGALPAGVTIGASQVQPGTYPTGDFTLRGILHWLTTLSATDQVEDWQQGYGLFSDNVGVFAGSTSRLWLASDGSAQISELHIGPRTGNVLNWARFRAANFRIDGTGATTPGSFQVQGGVKTSLDAGAITTDGAGNITCASVNNVLSKVAQATITVTDNATHTVVTFTPVVDSLFLVGGRCRVNTSVSGNIQFGATYVDSTGTARGSFFSANDGDTNLRLLAGGVAIPNGEYGCMPVFVREKGGSAITVTYLNTGTTTSDTVEAVVYRVL